MTETTEAAAVDIYREVHKGLRVALFELLQTAGTVDSSDAVSVEGLVDLFADVDMMLQSHHAHEDGDSLGELIASHAASLLPVIDKGHDWSDGALDELRALVAGLATGADNAAQIYDATCVFVVGYFEHMQVEEKQVMPALQNAVSVEALLSIVMEIRTSVPPPDMCVFLRYMLPAMTPDERTTTLGGMKAGAPPEIFELFWGVAEKCLAPPELATVAERI